MTQGSSMQLDLISLLEEKYELMQGILQLTLEQEKALADEEVEPFAENLDKRQQLMSRVDAVNRSAASVSRVLNEGLPSANDADEATLANIGRIGELTVMINKVLANIAGANEKNAPLVNKKLDGYRNGLREARETMRTSQAYLAPPTLEDGVYFDKKK